ncbi:MAG: TlpA family protein disulfide reductase [Butyricimonas faecihominis]
MISSYFHVLSKQWGMFLIRSKKRNHGKIRGGETKAIDRKAPDFTLPDVNEKEVYLSNYKVKYVLIDFWASWCKPCRMKAKELKKHYPRLKELGIEVVSISCDKNKNQWLKAIEEDQPMWTQLLIDKKINGTDTADDYKVEFIPTLYLISPEGEILEKNPSMEEIETFVKKG